MSRINTNVDSLIALNNLERTNRLLGTSLTRLSTGLRVNSGKDDPGALVSSEFLRQELAQISSALQNNARSNSMIGTAEGALREIGSLLEQIQGLITTTANTATLSPEEIEANQLVVNNALESINRIANNTQFAGKKLVSGALSFQTTGLSFSTATVQDVRINQAPIGIDPNDATTSVAVTVDLTVTFTQATFTTTLATGAANANQTAEVQISGNRGASVVRLSTDSGGTIAAADFAAAVNGVSDLTGVTAAGAVVNSEQFGDAQFVTVTQLSGPNILGGTLAEVTDNGADAGGTINGFAFTGIGRRALLKTGNLDIEVTFGTGYSTGAANVTFNITGGGAQFQIGQEPNENSQFNLGINSVHSGVLGNNEIGRLSSIASGGTNDLISGDLGVASRIVELATTQVSTLRARLGAFQAQTIDTTVNSLQVSQENISAARSVLIDTDFAAETATLTRLQILVQAGTSALAIANARPQSVLALLG